MLALRKTGPDFGAQLQEVPEPTLGEGMVMIEVDAAGICGSDIHMYEWTSGYEWLIPALPVTMGHEFAGRISQIGPNVSGLSEGQPVVVMPSYTCGTCEACRSGKADLCTNRKAVGLSVDGAFAPRVPVPARCCLPIGNKLAPHIAALTEPFCVGDRAVDYSSLEPGQAPAALLSPPRWIFPAARHTRPPPSPPLASCIWGWGAVVELRCHGVWGVVGDGRTVGGVVVTQIRSRSGIHGAHTCVCVRARAHTHTCMQPHAMISR